MASLEDIDAESETLWVEIRRLKRRKTLSAVRQARQLLRDWLAEHPEDYSSRDGGEELAMLEEALEIIVKEHASEPVAA